MAQTDSEFMLIVQIQNAETKIRELDQAGEYLESRVWWGRMLRLKNRLYKLRFKQLKEQNE